MTLHRANSGRSFQVQQGHGCEGRLKALGPEHLLVAWSLEQYATLLRDTGRAGAGKKLEARANAIRAKNE
jgi:hypothetical protein